MRKRIGMIIALLLALPLAAPNADAACQSEAVARANEEQNGYVTTIGGDLAQQIARLMWRSAGREPPAVESIMIVARKDGTITVIPVSNGLVCVAMLRSTEQILTDAVAKARASLP